MEPTKPLKRVLIIEDDPVVAHVYRTKLESTGYTADLCQDGLSGLTRAQEIPPDAVLLDVMLPKMNGLDVLKNLRVQQRFSSVPIVVLTNAYIQNMVQDALAAGATKIFNKATVTPAHLID